MVCCTNFLNTRLMACLRSSCHGCAKLCRVVAQTFKHSAKAYSPEKHKLEHLMHNKAFIIHCFLTIARVMEYGSGRSLWDKWKEKEPSLQEEGSRIGENILSLGHGIAIALLIIGLILDLCCIKWRTLARCFFHIEMCQIGLLRMIPRETCSAS